MSHIPNILSEHQYLIPRSKKKIIEAQEKPFQQPSYASVIIQTPSAKKTATISTQTDFDTPVHNILVQTPTKTPAKKPSKTAIPEKPAMPSTANPKSPQNPTPKQQRSLKKQGKPHVVATTTTIPLALMDTEDIPHESNKFGPLSAMETDEVPRGRQIRLKPPD